MGTLAIPVERRPWPVVPRYLVGVDGTVVGPCGRVLSARRHRRSGYLYVTAAGRRVAVHGVVARTFLGPRPRGLQVAHCNGDQLDNRVANLRYATHAENMADRKAHGTTARGERHGRAKLTYDQVEHIRETHARGDVTMTMLASEHGVDRRSISRIIRGERWVSA